MVSTFGSRACNDRRGKRYLRLETADEVHQEWMSHGVHNFKDVFLRHKTLDLVACKNVGLLQSLYCKVLAG